MKTIHVVQHTSAEYLGLVEDHLEGRGIRFAYHRPFATRGALPAASGISAGLIVMGGGPWGSAGTRDVPTLAAEVDLVRGCIARSIPVVGIGLGAQILSIAEGGRSEPAPLEFSVGTAERVTDAALGGYLPQHYPLAIYMRDWPIPPPHAVVLARDARARAVLWQSGSNAFGFAGHPGWKVAMVEDLVMEFEESPADLSTPLAQLRDVQRAIEDALVPIMTGLVACAGWMDERVA